MTIKYILERDKPPLENIILFEQWGKSKNTRILCLVFSFWPEDNHLTRDCYDPSIDDADLEHISYGIFPDAEVALKKAHQLAFEFYEKRYRSKGPLEDRTGL